MALPTAGNNSEPVPNKTTMVENVCVFLTNSYSFTVLAASLQMGMGQRGLGSALQRPPRCPPPVTQLGPTACNVPFWFAIDRLPHLHCSRNLPRPRANAGFKRK